jgi:exosortase
MPDLKSLLTPRTALIAVFLAAIGWSCWPVLTEMAARWDSDPRYSHGYLIPLFAIVILALRWDRCPAYPGVPNWWGLLPILAGMSLQLLGTYVFNYWLQGMALIPYTLGIALMFGGWRGLLWAAPAIAFLLFMIPLPYRLEGALGQGLQNLSTLASVFTLQLLGMPVLSSGNIIRLGTHQLNVAEACSGLSMLMTFYALSAAAAVLIDRPRIYKIIILLSAAPIAVIANVIRIVITSVLYTMASSELAEKVFHDVAGWVMMPLGLGLLWFELWVLSKLLVDEGRPGGDQNPSEPKADVPSGGEPKRDPDQPLVGLEGHAPVARS